IGTRRGPPGGDPPPAGQAPPRPLGGPRRRSGGRGGPRAGYGLWTRGHRLWALYVVALDSGARQGELWALGRGDVDWERAALSISKSLAETHGKLAVKTPKTKHGARRVPLSAPGLEALRGHRARMEAEGHKSRLVFCDETGGFLRKSNFGRRDWKRAL